LRQERFCELFTSASEFFGNGVQSYIEAYDVNTSKPGAYESAKTGAFRLLHLDYINKRIDELLIEGGLNDQYVDKQLLFLIQQKADFRSKRAAIAEYNKLKGRITDKVQHSGSINVSFDKRYEGI